jgi:hypothetical protein
MKKAFLYAFEIFDYQTSIFHPAYLYPLFLPLFVLTVLTFYFLICPRAGSPVHETGPVDTAGVAENQPQ